MWLHIGSEADIPAAWRPGCPHRLNLGALLLEVPEMLRLQSPLGERYRDASPQQLADWIRAAKATLGERLFILGHHYQRDEVMEWADARGDSFRLSVLAQEHPSAEYIVF